MDMLSLIVFFLAFSGMVVVHEFGHFIVARWSNIEVEEFGIGLPSPGALTFWISKGYLLLKSGKRIEIPNNFRFPVNWNRLIGLETKITVDEVKDRFVMRSLEAMEGKDLTQPSASQELIKAGTRLGELELRDVITEVHPGTRFTFNWLLLGGFVRPKGEMDPNVKGGLAAASPWKRLAVLFAGPTMNLLTAVVIFSIIISMSGGIMTSEPNPEKAKVLITNITPNSPAAQAGMKIGDVLISGAGKPISASEDIRGVVEANVNKPISFVVERDGKQINLQITPRFNAKEERPLIGIEYCDGCIFKPVTSWSENIQVSLRFTGMQIYQLVTLPVKLIRGTIAPDQSRLVGLKGIYDIMKQSVTNDVQASQQATTSSSSASGSPYDKPVQTLLLIAALSISLGVFNLFPIPALDGGRIIFVLPELIVRRRVPAEFENIVHAVGMTALLILMIYINVMDFVKPINLP